MRKSEATDFLEKINKPAVSWLELCYGDKRLNEACCYGMGYSKDDLEKARIAYDTKIAAEAAKAAQATEDDQSADGDENQDQA